MSRLLFALLLAAGPALASAKDGAPPAAAAVPTAKPDVESLDAAQIARALELLRTRHVRGASLDETGLARATLRGILAAWGRGAEIVDGPPAAPPASPFRSEALEGGVGYVRLGSLQTENLAQLDAALRGFAAAKAAGVVLDLRATPDSQDFDLAAQVASRFAPAGAALWTLSPAGGAAGRDFTASGERLFPGTIAVVSDGGVSGAAEALAAALRRHAGALLVGSTTAGRAAEFAVLPLGGAAQLRIAAAEVKVDSLPSMQASGLVPDIPIAQDPSEREEILAASLEKGVAPFVFERERARFNEAALVAGTNPEIDAASGPDVAQVPDRPLQRAVDVVTAISLFRTRGAD